MLGSGFNIEEIRNLNKIRIYGVMPRDAETHRSKGVTSIYEAYMTSPLGGFKAGVNTQDGLAKQMGDFVSKHSTIFGMAAGLAKDGMFASLADKANAGLVNTLGTAFDLANDINYNYGYRYTGTTEFNHTFQTELVVKNDFIDDIITPLWNLLSYVLPDETRTTGSTAVYQSLEYGVQAFYEFISSSVDDLIGDYIKSDTLKNLAKSIKGGVDKKVTNVTNSVNDITSSISGIKKPKQLSAEYSHTRILIGDYICIDDVIITDVNFNVPYLFYEGGLFDKLTVDISVKGNRKMTLKTYDWIKWIKNGWTSGEMLGEEKNIIPLNSRYENSYDKDTIPLKQSQKNNKL